MSDPQLNSIHLGDLPRRDAYRQARLQLEGACGGRTLAGALPAQDVDLAGVTRDAPPLMPGGAAHLWLKDGEQFYPLLVGVNSIGRLPDNSVVIKDEHVSRRHCALISHTNGNVEVHDIASKNGTILNGKKIAGPTRVRPGDSIVLCNHPLLLVAEDNPNVVSAKAGV